MAWFSLPILIKCYHSYRASHLCWENNFKTHPMDYMNETIGGLIIITGLVLIVWIIAKYTYLIKKTLADQGLAGKASGPKISKMDVIFSVAGIGIGLLMVAYLSSMSIEEDILDPLSWGIILICASAGLFVANKIN